MAQYRHSGRQHATVWTTSALPELTSDTSNYRRLSSRVNARFGRRLLPACPPLLTALLLLYTFILLLFLLPHNSPCSPHPPPGAPFALPSYASAPSPLQSSLAAATVLPCQCQRSETRPSLARRCAARCCTTAGPTPSPSPIGRCRR